MTHLDLKKMARSAKESAFFMAKATTAQKNSCLRLLAEKLEKREGEIIFANDQDILKAKEAGLEASLLERLSLKNRLGGIINDLLTVENLPDPVGEIFEKRTLPNRLELERRRTPIGVLGVIYESRPNVTIDISALAIKSGNCAILRGGSETLNTNKVLVELIQEALDESGLPKEAIQWIKNPDRSYINELLQLHDYVDLIIPRGSEALQEFCKKHSTIPVITGGAGICHLFVDKSADQLRSIDVILNAKVQRPTVCNALDTLLVHELVAEEFIPKVVHALSEKGVTFRLDEKASSIVKNPLCKKAALDDWDQEWLSLVLGIKVVKNLEEAVHHIHMHSRNHSDGILTEDKKNADLFIKAVDSAAVYVNASTRFTDGGQFGLGSEVAVSTQKLHARGPMGLNELTSYKWVIQGDYQVRT